MFFLGVAFMLLEVKSLTTFALLFGSTWQVNSLVFFAILTSVLLAVLVNSRFRIKRIGIWYTLLHAQPYDGIRIRALPSGRKCDNPGLTTPVMSPACTSRRQESVMGEASRSGQAPTQALATP